MVGNHFLVLARGEVDLDVPREYLSLEKLMFHMAGGTGLATLQHELHHVPTAEAASASARRDSSHSRRQP
jgi:simple sugar transport system ATP-binding protein